jgi:MFS family permease
LIDNAMFALLIEQLPEARATTLWNLAYDAGYGAAPAVFGLFAARTGYPAAFALTGTLVLAALPAALREWKAVSAPRAWRDHSRARPDAPPAPVSILSRTRTAPQNAQFGTPRTAWTKGA